MSHSGHGRVMCSCGNVILQCRCMENHHVLETRPHPACGRKPGVDVKRLEAEKAAREKAGT